MDRGVAAAIRPLRGIPVIRPLEISLLGKIFLLTAILLGAGLYFPSTRPTVMDVLAPVINPALIWQTRGEMAQITRELQMINRQGQSLPAPGQDFSEWMVRNFQGGSSRDSWGNEYSLIIWPDSIAIVSRGPDLEIATPDDVIETARIQRQRRRR